MGQVEPTGRLDDEESESFEAQEASAPAAADREDWPEDWLVSNFVFVGLLELVDVYVCQAVGPAVSEKVADFRQDLEGLRFRRGRLRHEPALVGSA